MRFYSFLIFLELLDRIGKFLIKIFFISTYLTISSYILYIENFGIQNALVNNIFYRPEITLKYLYKYIKWWYKNRQNTSFKVTFGLIIAITLPYLIYRILKYFLLFIIIKLNQKIGISKKITKFTQKKNNTQKIKQQNNKTISKDQ